MLVLCNLETTLRLTCCLASPLQQHNAEHTDPQAPSLFSNHIQPQPPLFPQFEESLSSLEGSLAGELEAEERTLGSQLRALFGGK